jgi:hypothetical protein
MRVVWKCTKSQGCVWLKGWHLPRGFLCHIIAASTADREKGLGGSIVDLLPWAMLYDDCDQLLSARVHKVVFCWRVRLCEREYRQEWRLTMKVNKNEPCLPSIVWLNLDTISTFPGSFHCCYHGTMPHERPV